MTITCSPETTAALLTATAVFVGFALAVALGIVMGRCNRGKA